MPDETTRAPVSDPETGADESVARADDDEVIELPGREALSIVWPGGEAGGPDLYPLPDPVRGGEAGGVPDPDWDA